MPHHRRVTRDQIVARYEAYLDACNRHAWDELAPFLADTVIVNGVVRTKAEYAADLSRIDHAFPDYRWQLQRAVVEADWLAVRLRARGTRTGPFQTAHGDGARVETDELNMYRFADDVIQELDGTADNARLTA
jgi:predicted ester cyclase